MSSNLAAQQRTMTDYVAAWATRDPQLAASAYVSNGVVKMAGAPDVVGRDAIAGMLAGQFGASNDDSVPFARTFLKGDLELGEWIWSGTHTGDLMGIPPTHKRFGVRGVTVYHYDADAKFKEARVYFDAGTLLAQLGVSPQPARPVLAAPTSPPVVLTATGTPEEERNLAHAHKMMGAFETRRSADFVAGVSDRFTWEDMAQPAAIQGREAALARFEALTSAFSDLKSTGQAWATGDHVIVEHTWSGTHDGALGPIPATHKPVQVHVLDILQFDSEGKVLAMWSYSNSFELLMQLGLIPAPT